MVSVAGVHQEVSEQTHAINKSEVYSHYWGLLFRLILALFVQKQKGSVEKTTRFTGEANWPLKLGSFKEQLQVDLRPVWLTSRFGFCSDCI